MTKKTHIAVATACVMPLVTPASLIYIPASIFGGIFADFDYKVGIEHRTATHSFLAMCFMSMFIYFTVSNKMIALCFAIGYMSHLILDYFTVMGVMWLYPFQKRYSLGLCKTRDATDLYIRLLAIAFIALTLKKYINIDF